MAEGGDLRADGLDDRRVGVAERVDRDPADEVEVLLAVGVPQPGARAADEGQPRGAVVVHQRALPPLGELARCGPVIACVPCSCASGTTIVPMPSSVKISSRIECWTRPSMTRAVVDAVAYGVQTALHLRHHAAGQLRQQLLQLGGGEAADHLVAVGPVLVEALDVREDHEGFGAQRSSECRSRRISIDVVDMSVVLAAGDRRDDRDPAVGEQCLDRARVDRGDLAHPPDVDQLAVDLGLVLGGGDGVRVLAGQPDGERPVLVEQPDQLALDLPGEHHPYDVHGVLGGDPAGPP